MLLSKKLEESTLLQNILIWIFVFLIFGMVITADNQFLISFFIVAFLIIPVYINNLKILPFFNKENKTLGVFLFLLNAFLFALIAVSIIFQLSSEPFQFDKLLNIFGAMILALLFSSTLKVTKDGFIRRQEIKNAELQLLKAQLNPHFLFNTLNNLYGLSVLKSDILPELMLKLSDLLRYSLYETREQYVSLDKEIQYLENYVALEKIRLEDKTEITFEVSDKIHNTNIPPMLLIVFVENAFKHLSTFYDEKNKVHISIASNENHIAFTCINSVDKTKKEEDLEKSRSGIGLENAKKRLDLIYPSSYDLTIEDNNETYSVQLKLITK